MIKAEWGEKRVCGGCESLFYDMQQNPIVCPKCLQEYKADKPRKFAKTPTTRIRKITRKAKSIELNNDFEGQLFNELSPGSDDFLSDTDEFFQDDSGMHDDLRF